MGDAAREPGGAGWPRARGGGGGGRSARRPLNPLFLHGPSGTGKTHLVAALVEQVTRQAPDRLVAVLGAGDFEALVKSEDHEELARARGADLLVVEDVQHLPSRTVEAFVQVVDRGLAAASSRCSRRRAGRPS